MIREYRKNNFIISNDKRKLQTRTIHQFLTNSYWDKGVKLEEVKRKIKHSYCFGVYHKNEQIGFCRVITDFTALSYLADVFILKEFRGRGLSKWLMKCVTNHPELKQTKSWMLKTTDAHGLYEKYGFRTAPKPKQIMEMKRNN